MVAGAAKPPFPPLVLFFFVRRTFVQACTIFEDPFFFQGSFPPPDLPVPGWALGRTRRFSFLSFYLVYSQSRSTRRPYEISFVLLFRLSGPFFPFPPSGRTPELVTPLLPGIGVSPGVDMFCPFLFWDFPPFSFFPPFFFVDLFKIPHRDVQLKVVSTIMHFSLFQTFLFFS